MNVTKNIVLVMMVILISLAVISCSGSDQQTAKTTVKSTSTAKAVEKTSQPAAEKPAERPAAPAGMSKDAMMVVMKLQMIAGPPDIEPELAFTAEQIEGILPVLEEWQAAVAEDESAVIDPYVAKIDELMTEEQRAFMPQRGMMGGGKSADMSDEQMQQQRAMRMDPNDMLSFIIETLSGTV